jgi:hypothetical protein
MFLLVGPVLLGGLLPLAVARAAMSAPSAPAVTLSGAAAERAAAVSPPVISAPPTAAGATGQFLSITATATDPDAADLLTITATGAPASLAFSHLPSVSPATATLSGTLGAGDIGSWMILWEVSDGTFMASATTALTVGTNLPPVVSAPAVVPGAVSVEMAFAVTVSDPDGDAINSLTSSALPSGATFTVNALLTSGGFEWTPTAGQEGTYNVTFTAESGSPALAAAATSMLQIGPEDLPPTVSAPGTVNGKANHPLSFTATCSDPHGEAIDLFLLTGSQNTPLPAGAVWTVNASNTSGTLTWTPTMAQVGTVNLRYRATDAEPFPLSTGPEQYTTKVVVAADGAPVVSAPASVSVAEGDPLTVNVTASDPDGDAIASLTASGAPLGATFSAGAGNTTGTLQWTPSFSEAGTYSVTFTASNLLSGSATTAIQVTGVNRAPTADAGGPYSGVVGSLVVFDGSASSDADGDALTFEWDFGDGGTGTGDMPSHAYGAAGDYDVTLTVTDAGSPALTGSASTTASIQAVLDAHLFTVFPYHRIWLGFWWIKQWCVQVEPIGGNFHASDVVASTVVLQYGGQEIHAIVGKPVPVLDWNRNGVAEFRACFKTSDLKTLFAGLPSGLHTVTVTIEGSLTGGGQVRGSLQVQVFKGFWNLAASVTPNPFNPEAKLSFETGKAGALRVRLYDLHGRLVRTLVNEANAAAGSHEYRIDGRADDGTRLPSGTYFFRIEAAEGQSTGRVSILK